MSFVNFKIYGETISISNLSGAIGNGWNSDADVDCHPPSSDHFNLNFALHLFCFISNAVKKQPVDTFVNFKGVA